MSLPSDLRPRRGARRALNTIDRPPAREWLVLVGAPSNTLNGWYCKVSLREGVRPEIEDRSFLAAQAPPRAAVDVGRYLTHGPRCPQVVIPPWDGRQDRELFGKAWRGMLSPDEWAHWGWSAQALDRMVDRGWTPAEIESDHPRTHDLFWGDFALPAKRLYESSILQLPAVIDRPRPRQGDIVTYLVWWPGYRARDALDWEATPYNPANVDPSTIDYLGGPVKPRATGPRRKDIEKQMGDDYPSLRMAEKAKRLSTIAAAHGRLGHVGEAREFLSCEGEEDGWGESSLPEWRQRLIFRNALGRILRGEEPNHGQVSLRDAEQQAQHERELRADREPTRPLTDAEINRHLYERSIGENTNTITRRNKGGTCRAFIQSIVDVYLPSGTTFQSDGLAVTDVQIRVLLIEELGELIDYVARGEFTGRDWRWEWQPPQPGDPTEPHPRSYEEWLASQTPEDRAAMAKDPEEGPAFYRSYVEVQRQKFDRRAYSVNHTKQDLGMVYFGPDWANVPAIDRNKIKIARLDYFGHAWSDAIVLQYGWSNKKGEMPQGEVRIEARELDQMFRGRVTSADAVAVLWGCSLGRDDPAALARVLAEKGYFRTAIGADSTTDFKCITDDEDAMPEPSRDRDWAGSWQVYPKP